MPVPNILFGLSLILNGESVFSKKSEGNFRQTYEIDLDKSVGNRLAPKSCENAIIVGCFAVTTSVWASHPAQSAPAKHIIFAWQKLSIPFSRSLTQRVLHNYAVTMRVRASERAGYSPAALHKLADRPSFLPPSADATQQQSNIWSKCQTADASCSAS